MGKSPVTPKTSTTKASKLEQIVRASTIDREQLLSGDMSIYDYYDAWSQNYDDIMKEWSYHAPSHCANQLVKILKSQNLIKKGKTLKLLDIGCGTGLTAKALLDVAPFPKDLVITGADIMPSMLNVSREKGIYSDL